jgi:hypothetical protein
MIEIIVHLIFSILSLRTENINIIAGGIAGADDAGEPVLVCICLRLEEIQIGKTYCREIIGSRTGCGIRAL